MPTLPSEPQPNEPLADTSQVIRPSPSGTNNPGTSGAADPAASGAAHHGTSSAAHPSTSSAAHPSTSDAAHPSTSDAIHSSTSDAAHPSTSGAAHPVTSDAIHPSTSDAAHLSTSSTTCPSSSGAAHPVTSDAAHPSSSDAAYAGTSGVGGPGSAEANEPSRRRDMAESFGADPGLYDRARPSYPNALIEAVVASAPGPDVLDVGCGTGIAARQFQAAGCRVLGVEVDERMAAYARTTGVEVEVSPFECWDPRGRTFDALVAGMTWHWIDPAAGAARAAAALRPGGTFAVFWYVLTPPADLGAAFAAVHRDVLPDNPAASRAAASPLGAYEQFLDRTAASLGEAFTDLQRQTFPWSRTYTRDEWLDQLRTSGMAKPLADAGKLDAVLAGTAAAIDAAGGSFTLDSVAVALIATRK